MTALRSITLFAAALVASATLDSAEFASAGFRPLFNGHDLSGWARVNCAPGTFTVRDQMIVSTGVPTGVLRTDRQYENFELELEWKHLKAGGNAGLFVWSEPLPSRGVPFTKSLEVQILDGRNTQDYTSHGDVFAIHGARFTPDRPHPGGWMRSLPTERRSKPAGEWNHYRVVCNNGRIQLAVNGKVVSGGSESVPRKGYICLEAEGSECHFKNIIIKELPSTNPTPSEIAPIAQPFQSLYTGLNLDGWATPPEGQWKAEDWTLISNPREGGVSAPLWSEPEFDDFVMICDWKQTGAGHGAVVLRGPNGFQVSIGSEGSGTVLPWGDRSKRSSSTPAIAPTTKADEPIGSWNRFEITLRDRLLTVVLNGTQVIANAPLPGIPENGPIGLVNDEGSIAFANLFVRKLP
jgi:hypothetical protein